MEFVVKDLKIIKENNLVKILDEEKVVITYDNNQEYLDLGDKKVLFSSLEESVSKYNSGTYQGFTIDYKNSEYEIRCFYLIEEVTRDILIRFKILRGEEIKEVYFPACQTVTDAKFVLPLRQGILLDTSEVLDLEIPFNGMLNSCAAYLSMLGVIKEEYQVLYIKEDSYDARYYLSQDHISNSITFGFSELASLGAFARRRDLRIRVFNKASYVELARSYKTYVKEKGLYKSLKEKMVNLPKIKDLIETSFIHTGIRTNVVSDSRFYDAANPSKNNHLTTFNERLNDLLQYESLGLKYYVHLDGIGYAYDNNHPDYYPIGEASGGEKDFINLVNTLQEKGYLFGIHDQYRDYYYSAKSHDLEYAIVDIKGDHYSHNFWAGGKQNYLCATLAIDYVKRNFTYLNSLVKLDAAYLDVFTCNELDECFNPNHLMDRKTCMESRLLCFKYLVSKKIMPSSEEVNEWAINDLVFSHYAPYEEQMNDKRTAGRSIPLFNLIYHECLVTPFMMDLKDKDYMLYALINGGVPYFRRDAAYPNIDGAFESKKLSIEEKVNRCKKVSEFYKSVWDQELVNHEILSDTKERSTFSNGRSVTVDFKDNSFEIL